MPYIISIYPDQDQVILNLKELYSCEYFQAAIRENQQKIRKYNRGIGRYFDSQKEVILEVDSVTIDNIESLGGHSSESITGRPEEWWLSREGTQNVLMRVYENSCNVNFKY